MPNYNKVMLMGHLTRDPELKFLPSNTPVAEFGIANNRRFKRQDGEQGEETLFMECVSFGKQGEVINQHFHKGKAIFIEGRLKLDQWEDKQSGQKRSKVRVIVESFEFLGGRDEGGSPPANRAPASEKMVADDGEIPF